MRRRSADGIAGVGAEAGFVYPGRIELTVSYGENAHSAMFDFASTIAPAARIRATKVASCRGIHPLSASEPAVV